MSIATKVLSIAELLYLISDHLGRSDRAMLSRVCRRNFNLLVPLVWKQVDGAQNLFTLIKFAIPKYKRTNGRLISIEFDPEIAESGALDNFDRLDLYAPHVHRLGVFGRKYRPYSLVNFNVLCSQLDKRGSRSLLPNLHQFDLSSVQNPSRLISQVQCIDVFGTDTVHEVIMRPGGLSSLGLTISHQEATTITNALSLNCPNLRMLCLYPRDDVKPSLEPEGLGYEGWRPNLKKFTKLRDLSLTNGCLNKHSLLTLGKLPKLRVLDFTYGDFVAVEDSSTVNAALSSTAFSNLRALSLNVRLADQIYILELQKMIKRINKLDLCLRLSMGFEDDTFGFEASKILVERRLLPLFVNMPNLGSLTVKAWSPCKDADLPVEFPEFLDAISRPPLVDVHLDGVHFRSSALERNLGTVWPQLRRLSLPAQDASLQELACFATIPNLCYLKVKLNLTTTFTPTNIIRSERAPLTFLKSSPQGKISAELEVIKHNARVLLSLWPKMSRIALSKHDDNNPSVDAFRTLCILLSSPSMLETEAKP